MDPTNDRSPDDSLPEVDNERLALIERLADDFAAALQGDPGLTPEAFAERHGQIPPGELVPVLRGTALLARSRARSDGPFRPGDRAEGYRILSEIGRGGMGVVYEALEEELGRTVAIKALHAGGVDERFRARFVREARAAAQLDHPGIVPVFGSGESQGVLWYAMRRVEGVALDQCLTDLSLAPDATLHRRALALLEGTASSGSRSSSAVSSGLSPRIRAAATVAMRLADALAYAHAAGVLHRDIKPGNVMLDRDGTPLLTDFGLCKVEDDASLTADTDVVGTLRYLAPEALAGAFDARSDIYGVGLVLYEIVTGSPAFVADDRVSMLHRILHVDPPPMRRSAKGVPEDLERIVSKATAKLPEERYASASELADDLNALLSGKPVRARRPSALYLARLFVRRNRALAATLAVAAVLLAAGAIQYVSGLKSAYEDTQAALDLAELRMAQANLATAEAALRSFDAAGAADAVEEVRPEHRDWMWRFLAERVGRETRIEAYETFDASSVAVSPSGDRVAVCAGDRLEIRRRDGMELERTVEGGALDAAFVEDGRALVWLSRSPRNLYRLEVGSDEDPVELQSFGSTKSDVSGLTDDSFVLLIEGYRRVEAYDVRTGERQWWRQFNVPRISAVAPLSRTRFVFGTTGGKLYEVDVTDDSLEALPEHNAYVRSLLVEDGELLASGSDDGFVILWPELTGHARARLVLDGAARAFARDPNDPNRLAVATSAKSVELIDIPTAVVRRRLAGLTNDPLGVSFGANPWIVAITDGLQAAHFEDRGGHDGRIDLPPAIGNMYPPTASADGRWIAASSNDGILHVYDLLEGRVRSLPHRSRRRSHPPAIDRDGERVACNERIFDLASGETLFALDGGLGAAHGTVWLPDDSAAMITADLETNEAGERSLRVWRWSEGETEAQGLGEIDVLLPTTSRSDQTIRAISHPAEPSLFVIADRRDLARYDLDPLRERWRVVVDKGRHMAIDYDAAADEVFVACQSGFVHVVDGSTGAMKEGRAWRAGPSFTPRASLNSIAIGPEPGLVTTCTVDCRIEVWEAETGRHVGALTTDGDSYMRHVTVLGESGWVVGVGGFGRVALFGSGPNPAAKLAGSCGMDLPNALERTKDWLAGESREAWIADTATQLLRAVERSTRFRSTPWLEAERAEIQAMLED